MSTHVILAICYIIIITSWFVENGEWKFNIAK